MRRSSPNGRWAFEAGLEHWIGRRVRLDIADWHRAIAEAADPNVFAATTIIFPNAVAQDAQAASTYGWRCRKTAAGRLTRTRALARSSNAGPSLAGCSSRTRSQSLGMARSSRPITISGWCLAADSVGCTSDRALTFSFAGRYESGTPIERGDEELDELAERPGAEMVDFDRGRVKPRTVVSAIGDVPVWRSQRRSLRLRLSVLNLFDDEYAYNFGNPFSGTHFGALRTFAISNPRAILTWRAAGLKTRLEGSR